MYVSWTDAEIGKHYLTDGGARVEYRGPAQHMPGWHTLTKADGQPLNVPESYRLRALADDEPEPALSLDKVVDARPAELHKMLPQLTDAQLDELPRRDSRIFVVAMVEEEAERRRAADAELVSNEQHATCPECGKDVTLRRSSSRDALVLAAHRGEGSGLCLGSSREPAPAYDDAYKAGRAAWKDGKGAGENPHPEGTDAWSGWAHGFARLPPTSDSEAPPAPEAAKPADEGPGYELAYSQGAGAAMHGQPQSANPYKRGTPSGAGWYAGWMSIDRSTIPAPLPKVVHIRPDGADVDGPGRYLCGEEIQRGVPSHNVGGDRHLANCEGCLAADPRALHPQIRAQTDLYDDPLLGMEGYEEACKRLTFRYLGVHTLKAEVLLERIARCDFPPMLQVAQLTEAANRGRSVILQAIEDRLNELMAEPALTELTRFETAPTGDARVELIKGWDRAQLDEVRRKVEAGLFPGLQRKAERELERQHKALEKIEALDASRPGDRRELLHQRKLKSIKKRPGLIAAIDRILAETMIAGAQEEAAENVARRTVGEPAPAEEEAEAEKVPEQLKAWCHAEHLAGMTDKRLERLHDLTGSVRGCRRAARACQSQTLLQVAWHYASTVTNNKTVADILAARHRALTGEDPVWIEPDCDDDTNEDGMNDDCDAAPEAPQQDEGPVSTEADDCDDDGPGGNDEDCDAAPSDLARTGATDDEPEPTPIEPDPLPTPTPKPDPEPEPEPTPIDPEPLPTPAPRSADAQPREESASERERTARDVPPESPRRGIARLTEMGARHLGCPELAGQTVVWAALKEGQDESGPFFELEIFHGAGSLGSVWVGPADKGPYLTQLQPPLWPSKPGPTIPEGATEIRPEWLRLHQMPDGSEDLWVHPPDAKPWRAGPADHPQLAQGVAAARLQAEHRAQKAKLEQEAAEQAKRHAARMAEELRRMREGETSAHFEPIPSLEALGQLGEVLAALKLAGISCELTIKVEG